MQQLPADSNQSLVDSAKACLLLQLYVESTFRTFFGAGGSLSRRFLFHGRLLVLPDGCLLPATIALKLNNQTKLQCPDIMAYLLFCPFVTQPLRVPFMGAFSMGRCEQEAR